jgi:hypothetical protein
MATLALELVSLKCSFSITLFVIVIYNFISNLQEEKKKAEKPDEPAVVTRSDTWKHSRLRPDPADPSRMIPVNEEVAAAIVRKNI